MRLSSLLFTAALAAASLTTSHAHAIDVYVNGVKATGLKGVNLQNCSVKFDALGNLHVISPGYRVITDKAGKPIRVTGSSDFGNVKAKAAKPTSRYVLLYRPNPKVSFTFTIFVNNKKFREIALSTGPFTVDLTGALHRGSNVIRVVGKPVGTAPATGGESDVSRLIVLQGSERADGTFVAKRPAVWELVRAAIDRKPIDRSSTLLVQ
ncbi:MAG: hypothetical protein KC502_00980 [Myxococcales bacterium]|nr:hypothetical protein [Myxococcales bacterium]